MKRDASPVFDHSLALTFLSFNVHTVNPCVLDLRSLIPSSCRYERCVDFELLNTPGSAERQPWIKLRGGSDFDSSSRLKRSSESDRYKLTSSENLSDETTEDENPQDQMIPDEDMTIDLHHEELELPKDVRVIINKKDKKVEVLDHHSVHVRHTTGNPRPRYPLKGDLLFALQQRVTLHLSDRSSNPLRRFSW